MLRSYVIKKMKTKIGIMNDFYHIFLT